MPRVKASCSGPKPGVSLEDCFNSLPCGDLQGKAWDLPALSRLSDFSSARRPRVLQAPCSLQPTLSQLYLPQSTWLPTLRASLIANRQHSHTMVRAGRTDYDGKRLQADTRKGSLTIERASIPGSLISGSLASVRLQPADKLSLEVCRALMAPGSSGGLSRPPQQSLWSSLLLSLPISAM